MFYICNHLIVITMGYTREFDGEILLDLLTSQPMSRDEQRALLNALVKKVYLDGIDKGTELERRVQKENEDRIEKKYRKELSVIFDPINDLIFDFLEKNKYKKNK